MRRPGEPSTPRGWVAETRFGTWFLGTRIWSRYVLEPALEQLLQLVGAPPHPLRSVLDLGCGEGRALPWLRETFRPEALVGIDVDAELVERARRRLADAQPIDADLRVGTATKLDLPDESVDLTLCHQTLHHLEDPGAALHEIHRVLRPGGILLAAESCRSFLRLAWVRLCFRHPPGAARPAEEWLELVRAGGFRFDRANVATASPWWSRRDLGMRERLGRPERPDPAPAQVLVAARRIPV